MKKDRKNVIFTTFGALMAAAGVILFILPFVLPKEALPDLVFPQIPSQKTDETAVYSDLTGQKLANAADKTAPAYCVQTPNGMDGARPQAGLDTAGVVFEAIAEAGITRFAAIYQNPSTAVIGPIRSLRIYYLQWDTPFDCTIVHAGGADDAIAAVRSGGYKDLSENYTYMYRSNAGARRWNNLFTTSTLLSQMNSDRGYGGSNITGFTRMTPADSLKARVDATAKAKLDIIQPTTENTSKLAPEASEISVKFGALPNFNVVYTYNSDTNTYYRGYASGVNHDILSCPSENLGEVAPESVCSEKVLNPSVVVAMVVQEKRAAYDGYHEDITTTGSGEAYVFQNGMVLHGKWVKNSAKDQIRFYDDSGVEIALAPGQTFVEAVPQYGSIAYN